MKNYAVEINIAAETSEEVEEKLQGFAELQQMMSHEDFIQIVEFLKEHPDTLNQIKELVSNPGKIFGVFKNAFPNKIFG